jgi:hypothetical protein
LLGGVRENSCGTTKRMPAPSECCIERRPMARERE